MSNSQDKDLNSIWVTFFRHLNRCVSIALLITILIFLYFYFFEDRWYEARSVLFPAFSTSPSRTLISRGPHPRAAIGEFGDIIEAERLVQVFYSKDIMQKVNEKYNLLKRYEIADKKYPYYKLIQKWEDILEVKRTSNHSVIIKFRDKDPAMAEEISNYIIYLGDSLITAMIQERARTVIQYIQQDIDTVKNQIINIVNRIMNNPAITFTEGSRGTRFAEFMKSQIEILSSIYPAKAKDILSALSTSLLNYPAVHSLYNELDNMVEYYSLLQEKLNEAKFEAQTKMPNFFVIEHPLAFDRPVYPNFYIVVVVSFFCACCAYYAILAIYLLYREYRKAPLKAGNEGGGHNL